MHNYYERKKYLEALSKKNEEIRYGKKNKAKIPHILNWML